MFTIETTGQAGQKPRVLTKNTSCIEVMTGAVLPEGCNCVIPVENVTIENNQVLVRPGLRFKLMQNVHPKGSDYPAETVLLKKGCVLQSPHIAVLATVGKAAALVSKQPKIAIFTTGDELVGIDQKPQAYQIRMSNSYAIRSALISRGYNDIEMFHLPDIKEHITNKLQTTLNEFDVHILSGGVSMGRYDFVPKVLNELGVKALFHKVKMKPGKPFWFGITLSHRPVFALPGNPVSALTCCYRFVLPYLDQASGKKDCPQEYVQLKESFSAKTPLTYFLPVKIEHTGDGKRLVLPMKPNGSGDLASLTNTDGFVELKEETAEFPAGFSAPFYKW